MFELKSQVVRDESAKKLLGIYDERQKLNLSEVDIEALQILLLLNFIPPTSKVTTKSGCIKTSIAESIDGFVVQYQVNSPYN